MGSAFPDDGAVEIGTGKLVLAGSDPAALGEAHGARWAALIRELAALRTELTVTKSDMPSAQWVHHVADAHLKTLRAFDGASHAELLGIARGAGATPAELVVLNHYTDLRDLRRPVWVPTLEAAGLIPPPPAAPVDESSLGEPDGCSVGHWPASAGAADDAVIGQTWDMHGSAEAYVRFVEVRNPDAPAATLLTLTGCLGMCGLNSEGVGVLINNLSSTDARVGVVWSALVRRMLRETTARGAYEVLRRARVGSGHHYLISDGRESFAVETSGQRVSVLHQGAANVTLQHTNHCLAEDLKDVERVPDGSTTYVRFDHMSRRLARPRGTESAAAWLAEGFADHEGFPRSLCVHLATPERPHAVATCGAVVLDHRARELWLVKGCTVDNPWIRTTVGHDAVTVGRPAPAPSGAPV